MTSDGFFPELLEVDPRRLSFRAAAVFGRALALAFALPAGRAAGRRSTRLGAMALNRKGAKWPGHEFLGVFFPGEIMDQCG